MTNTLTTATTTIYLVWSNSIHFDEGTCEQQHVFAHGNVKSARRTALARIRRWHGDVHFLAVLVNPTEQEQEEASSKAMAEYLAKEG
jgi:hypothetical protein